MRSRSPTGNFLVTAGVVFLLAGAILFLAKAGFPPGITTTYEYTAEGVIKTSSPSSVEIAASVGLVLVGAVLAKAGSVVESAD